MSAPTAAEIEAARTPAGGWTREQLAAWGVPWPPPKGWRKALAAGVELPPFPPCAVQKITRIPAGVGSAIRPKVDAAIDRGEATGCVLAFSTAAWSEFKRQVPRREYRKRQGTRFINAYRDVPISLHDEWAWGWQFIPTAEASPAERAA